MERYKSKFEENEITNAKKELLHALKGKMMTKDLDGDEITIATGGRYSIRVKILGYEK